jgi:hypothetical protein
LIAAAYNYGFRHHVALVTRKPSSFFHILCQEKRALYVPASAPLSKNQNLFLKREQRVERSQVPHIPLLRCGFSPQPTTAFSFPKNPGKSTCQAPRPPKIPITPTSSTTSLRKIVGIVVMLRLIQLTYGSNIHRALGSGNRPPAARLHRSFSTE